MEFFDGNTGSFVGFIVIITIVTDLMLSFKMHQKFKGETPETADETVIEPFIDKNIDLAMLSKKIQNFLYLQEFKMIASDTVYEPQFKERITARTVGFGQSGTVKITVTGKPYDFSVIGDFGSMKSAIHNSISMAGSATEKNSLRLKNHIIESFKSMIDDL
ncbi:MAG: hypothetical protein GKS07_09855 [Nitrosopumilus sp.]|nr:MAG: hypothetical protein GKS07_09855 [Nitrosopumilus sp.]